MDNLRAPSILGLIAVIIAVAVAIVVLEQLMPSPRLTYIDEFRRLAVNGSITATYRGALIERDVYGRAYLCNITALYSIGSVNGDRVFITASKSSCLPPEASYASQTAYWLNGTEICTATYGLFGGRVLRGIKCSPVRTASSILVFTPFRALLGNLTITDPYINYSAIVHIHYVNVTMWNGQTSYCYQVISNSSTIFSTTIQNNYAKIFICLLSNGIPAVYVFNETTTIRFPYSKATLAVRGEMELINYTLTFNATAFRELLSKTR